VGQEAINVFAQRDGTNISRSTIARLAAHLTETRHFTSNRRAIRAALVANGIAVQIEAVVDATHADIMSAQASLRQL